MVAEAEGAECRINKPVNWRATQRTLTLPPMPHGGTITLVLDPKSGRMMLDLPAGSSLAKPGDIPRHT